MLRVSVVGRFGILERGQIMVLRWSRALWKNLIAGFAVSCFVWKWVGFGGFLRESKGMIFGALR